MGLIKHSLHGKIQGYCSAIIYVYPLGWNFLWTSRNRSISTCV